MAASSSTSCFNHLSPSSFSTMEASQSSSSSPSSSSSSFCFNHLSPSLFGNKETMIKFQIHPLSSLKKAGSVLHDFGFQGLGRLDIDDKGFEVTVRDAESSSGAAYRLFIPSSSLKRFKCTTPTINKFIDVSRLCSFAQLYTYPRSPEYTTLTVTHSKGDDYLLFKYDCYPDNEYRLHFYTLDFLFVQRFPDTTVFSEALLPSKILKQLTERLSRHPTSELVALEIKAECVTVYIDYIEDVIPLTVECVSAREEAETRTIEPGGGAEAEITRTTQPVGTGETEITGIAQSVGSEAAEITSITESVVSEEVEASTTEPVSSEEVLQGETKKIKPGQTHHAWIKLRHCSVLDKASLLGERFAMCLCSKPADKVIMKFNIAGLGEYQFLNETIKVLPQYDERAVCLKLLLFSPLLDQ